jgi:DUF4097 and DUF4098 domain-containing protein YvlB
MMIRPSQWLLSAACAATIAPLASPALVAQSAQSATDTTFQVARDAVIEITLHTGRLVVRGEDRRDAELRTNGARYELRSSKVGVTLGVRDPSDRGDRRGSNRRSDETDVELIVPRAVRLVINGTTADVAVSSVSGDVEVSLVSGDFQGRALGSRAIIQTMAGDVRITEGVGDLRVTTVGGDVTASGVRGSIEVNATSGDIRLSGERLEKVNVDVVSGDIDLTGALADDARLQLSSHSGNVTLRLPEAAGGQLQVTTYTGDVRGGTMTMMPPVNRSFTGGREESGTQRYEFGGGGGARITVSTFTGDVTIQRGARRRSEE